MHINHPVLVAAFGVILASCAAHRDTVRTPFGAYTVDYERGPTERPIRSTGCVTRHYSRDANDSIRGFGFSNGYDGEQTLVSGLRLSDGSKAIPLPDSVTADLWNLDLESGRHSKIRTIDGLEGYSLHGSDGERWYTVVFFFSGDRYVGRVVSTLFQDIWFSPSGEQIILGERDYAVGSRSKNQPMPNKPSLSTLAPPRVQSAMIVQTSIHNRSLARGQV